MVPRFLLGLIGGFVATKVVSRLRHGGCHGGGHGGRGFGPRGARMVFRLMRELDLAPQQWSEVESLFGRLRQSFADLRGLGRQGLHDVAGAFGGEAFDRARIEAAAARQEEAVARLRKEAVDSLARLHEILTPAQRRRLHEILTHRFGDSPDGGSGQGGPGYGGPGDPHRTVAL